MSEADSLPADFRRLLTSLEESCLSSNDPILQSGFGGGLSAGALSASRC